MFQFSPRGHEHSSPPNNRATKLSHIWEELGDNGVFTPNQGRDLIFFTALTLGSAKYYGIISDRRLGGTSHIDAWVLDEEGDSLAALSVSTKGQLYIEGTTPKHIKWDRPDPRTLNSVIKQLQSKVDRLDEADAEIHNRNSNAQYVYGYIFPLIHSAEHYSSVPFNFPMCAGNVRITGIAAALSDLRIDAFANKKGRSSDERIALAESYSFFSRRKEAEQELRAALKLDPTKASKVGDVASSCGFPSLGVHAYGIALADPNLHDERRFSLTNCKAIAYIDTHNKLSAFEEMLSVLPIAPLEALPLTTGVILKALSHPCLPIESSLQEFCKALDSSSLEKPVKLLATMLTIDGLLAMDEGKSGKILIRSLNGSGVQHVSAKYLKIMRDIYAGKKISGAAIKDISDDKTLDCAHLVMLLPKAINSGALKTAEDIFVRALKTAKFDGATNLITHVALTSLYAINKQAQGIKFFDIALQNIISREDRLEVCDTSLNTLKLLSNDAESMLIDHISDKARQLLVPQGQGNTIRLMPPTPSFGIGFGKPPGSKGLLS